MRRIALIAVVLGLSASALAEGKHKSSVFQGSNAPKSSYRKEPLTKPSGNIWLRAENLGEEVRVNIYKPDGSFDNASLAKLDELFRCLSTGEVRAMSAELYEHLSRIQDHFDGKQIQFYSGFRLTDQSTSRHFHASAADFKIKGVSIYTIKKFAESLDMGNMGIGVYPNTDFVHVDIRAPGEPSFRWTDYSRSGLNLRKQQKKPGRTQPARKPVS
jgi:uncharacterized protein YcbK (DUF882 family)